MAKKTGKRGTDFLADLPRIGTHWVAPIDGQDYLVSTVTIDTAAAEAFLRQHMKQHHNIVAWRLRFADRGAHDLDGHSDECVQATIDRYIDRAVPLAMSLLVSDRFGQTFALFMNFLLTKAAAEAIHFVDGEFNPQRSKAGKREAKRAHAKSVSAGTARLTKRLTETFAYDPLKLGGRDETVSADMWQRFFDRVDQLRPMWKLIAAFWTKHASSNRRRELLRESQIVHDFPDALSIPPKVLDILDAKVSGTKYPNNCTARDAQPVRLSIHHAMRELGMVCTIDYANRRWNARTGKNT